MKKNLGSMLVFYFVFSSSLFASTYQWHVSANKNEAFVNEAVHLIYRCEFSDRAELSIIDFNPVGNYENYYVELLKKYETFKDFKRTSNYEFVLIPKKEGLLELEFDTIMKTTTQASIENTVLGRDNGEYEEFSKTKIKQKKLQIDVKQHSGENNNLIGIFNLKSKLDNKIKSAYEPYQLEVELVGTGDFEVLKPIEFDLDNVKVFAQKPILDVTLEANGYSGTWKQKFAFTADANFTIPSKKIEYFDLKTKKIKILQTPQINVTVNPAFEKQTLLDHEVDDSVKFHIEYLYYFLAFIVGYFARMLHMKIGKEESKTDPFKQKLESVKSFHELSVILIMHNESAFRELLYKIDTKAISSLKEAKNMAMEIYNTF